MSERTTETEVTHMPLAVNGLESEVRLAYLDGWNAVDTEAGCPYSIVELKFRCAWLGGLHDRMASMRERRGYDVTVAGGRIAGSRECRGNSGNVVPFIRSAD